MGLLSWTGKAKQTLAKIKNSIIQDCPPELNACEICRKLECNDEEWLNCEKRLQFAEFTKSPATDPLSPESDCRHHTASLISSSVLLSDSGSDDA